MPSAVESAAAVVTDGLTQALEALASVREREQQLDQGFADLDAQRAAFREEVERFEAERYAPNAVHRCLA